MSAVYRVMQWSPSFAARIFSLSNANSARSVVGGEGQDVVKNTEINLITISGYHLSVIAHRQVVQEYFTFRKFLYGKNSC